MRDVDVLDDGAPVEADAEGGGAVDKELMEDGAAHAAALAVREPGGGDDGTAGGIDGKEGDAVEGGTLSCGEVDAKVG